MLKILFVCSGNTCRSAMAEALFCSKIGEYNLPFAVEASSAGLSAVQGQKASGQVRQLLLQEGIREIENHRSSPVTGELVEDSDLILVMTAAHRQHLLAHYPYAANKTYLLKEFADPEQLEYDIDDPLALGPEDYRRIMEDIRSCIQKALVILKEEKGGNTN